MSRGLVRDRFGIVHRHAPGFDWGRATLTTMAMKRKRVKTVDAPVETSAVEAVETPEPTQPVPLLEGNPESAQAPIEDEEEYWS